MARDGIAGWGSHHGVMCETANKKAHKFKLCAFACLDLSWLSDSAHRVGHAVADFGAQG